MLAALDLRLQGRGQSTAVVALVTDAGIAGGSAGDSGAWLIQPLGMLDLTAEQHHLRIGTGFATPTPFQMRGLPGTLLIARDGPLKYAPADWICAIARGPDLERSADALVAAVRLKSGALQDNVGFVLARRPVT